MKRNRLGSVARKTTVDGITFDSAKEARRWSELKLLERAGEIRNLHRQTRHQLRGDKDWIKTPTGRYMTYVSDFDYIDMKTCRVVIEDAKGYRTEVYLMKKAIMAAMGFTVTEV